MPRVLLAVVAGVVVAHLYLLWDIARQLRSHAFTTAYGTITVSRAVDDTGHYFRWDLAFTYKVDGQDYTGTRVNMARGDYRVPRYAIERVIEKYPPGSPVWVYYDPADPTTAVLKPGVTDGTPAAWWILLFFQLLILGPALEEVADARHGHRFNPASPRHVTTTPSGVIAYLPATGFVMMLWVAVSAWFALMFLLLGVVAAAGKQPPATRDAIVLGAGAAAGVAVLGLTAAAGWCRLVRPTVAIDRAQRTLTFDPKRPYRSRIAIPFDNIESVESVPVAGHDEKCRPRTRFQVHLARTAADPLTLATYDDWRDADALAAWLRERLGLVG